MLKSLLQCQQKFWWRCKFVFLQLPDEKPIVTLYMSLVVKNFFNERCNSENHNLEKVFLAWFVVKTVLTLDKTSRNNLFENGKYKSFGAGCWRAGYHWFIVIRFSYQLSFVIHLRWDVISTKTEMQNKTIKQSFISWMTLFLQFFS